MIPLHDDNPTTLTPVVTIGIIAACVLVFFWQISLPAIEAQKAVYAFGLIPAVLLGNESLPPELAEIPATLSVVTSMFLHGGWMHLIGNMLYLWIFGNNIEDAMGHVRFVIFYLLCGVAAAMSQAFQDPSSVVPMIGASGAIGGVLGAYLLLYPRARVLVLVPLGFFLTTLRVPALFVLGIWFVLQFVYTAVTGNQAGGVAYWAHIGGFVAGLALIVPFRSRGHPLFGRGTHVRAGGSVPSTRRKPSPWTRGDRTTRRGPWD
ncbi:MAG: rhomboid family intramembrane serine protease [Alphaproteobacteria bacterium]